MLPRLGYPGRYSARDERLANPYKSPTDSRLDERTPPTTVSEANVLLALYGLGFLAWVAFIWALNLTFKDMFGGPAPSHTIYVLSLIHI